MSRLEFLEDANFPQQSFNNCPVLGGIVWGIWNIPHPPLTSFNTKAGKKRICTVPVRADPQKNLPPEPSLSGGARFLERWQLNQAFSTWRTLFHLLLGLLACFAPRHLLVWVYGLHVHTNHLISHPWT